MLLFALLGVAGAAPKVRRPADLRVTVRVETASRYAEHFALLEQWLADVGLPTLAELARQGVADAALQAHVQWLYDTRRPISYGSLVLAAAQLRVPSLRGHLRGAWAAQKKWGSLEPGETRVPMPVPVVLALAVLAWGWGWSRTSSLILLGFHALLRPAELCGLLRGHLRLPFEFDPVGGRGVVALTQTKTSSRAARLQSVVLTDALLLRLWTAVFGTDPARTLLCPGGRAGFDRRFALLLRELGLDGVYTPGCLRGGGAIAFFEATGSLGELQYRGRWEAPKSMLHYLQQGLAVSVWSRLLPTTRARIFDLAACAPLLLEAAGRLQE